MADNGFRLSDGYGGLVEEPPPERKPSFLSQGLPRDYAQNITPAEFHNLTGIKVLPTEPEELKEPLKQGAKQAAREIKETGTKFLDTFLPIRPPPGAGFMAKRPLWFAPLLLCGDSKETKCKEEPNTND